MPHRTFSAVMGLSGALLLAGGVSQGFAQEDPTCLNYYSVGESDCRPAASTPVQSAPAKEREGEAKPAESQKSEVDQYLDNYGKPPREFVEFYLNPTQENAQKWMATYRQMLQRGKDLSRAWQEADQLYQPQQETAGGLAQPIKEDEAPVLLEPVVPEASKAAEPKSKPAQPAPSIGAFSQVSPTGMLGGGGVRSANMSLVYYFSQTCPYCARMTPNLSEIARETKNKLIFTCVDVTPLGDKSKPNKEFITAKLPCAWRLPKEGEVEEQNIAQTPTILIQKEGAPEVRLSGYVPLAQLRQYF